MKNIKCIVITLSTISLYFCVACNTFASEITYDIYNHPQKLHITLKFNGNKNGITSITIPSNTWGHDLKKQIKNIQILDKSIKQKDLNTFLHKSNQRIELSYDVININISHKNKFFYTQSEKEGFFFLHDFALIYPKLNDQQKVVIRYHPQIINKEVFFYLKR